eukprot:766386-Hanusia_phi.AAC.2
MKEVDMSANELLQDHAAAPGAAGLLRELVPAHRQGAAGPVPKHPDRGQVLHAEPAGERVVSTVTISKHARTRALSH